MYLDRITEHGSWESEHENDDPSAQLPCWLTGTCIHDRQSGNFFIYLFKLIISHMLIVQSRKCTSTPLLGQSPLFFHNAQSGAITAHHRNPNEIHRTHKQSVGERDCRKYRVDRAYAVFLEVDLRPNNRMNSGKRCGRKKRTNTETTNEQLNYLSQ